MPKNTKEKDSKAKAKKVTSKKVNNNKKAVNTKKVEKVSEVKAAKPEKVVEVKKEVKKDIKVKEDVKKDAMVKAEKKGKVKEVIDKAANNTPFVVALCVIIVLLGALIFTVMYKKVPKTTDSKEVVASLKGKKITADDLYAQLKSQNGINALVNIIDEYIAEKEVKITDDDKAYAQEVVDYYKNYAEYYGTDLATFLANYVGLSGITTEDEFYNYVLKDYKKTLAVRKFIGDTASEEDLKAYYKANYSDKLTVRHILVEVDSDAEDQEAADKEALDKAKSLIAKLDKTSAKKLESKFTSLAKENSDDTGTYSDGGLLENISSKDVVIEFWDAAFKLKDGEYTKEPVKTTYGYHVILRVSSTQAEKYKDIIDDVKKAYAENLLSSDSTLFAKKWDELRKQYKLSIEDDLLKASYKKQLKDATGIEETEEEE